MKQLNLYQLERHYKNVILPELLVKGNYNNIHKIPKLERIVLNTTTKHVTQDSRQILPPLIALELITSKKAQVTKAKKSIANFKLRQKMSIGCKVTLRGADMYIFLLKLINVALPRVNDFKGVSINSFDGRGNLSFGLPDLFVFPELEEAYDKFSKTYGLDITIHTTAKTNEEAAALLSAYQLPLKKII